MQVRRSATDEHQEHDQQHPEEVPNRMSFLCRPCRLWRHRPACPPGPRGGPGGGDPGRGGAVRSRGPGPAGDTAPGPVVRLARHSRRDSASHGSVRAAPADRHARTTSRDPRRAPETCQQRYLGIRVRLPARRRGFSIAAAGTADTGRDLPPVPSPTADRKASRCQFAPRMLYRAPQPRLRPVWSEVIASSDAEV